MQIAPNVFVLPIPVDFGSGPTVLNLTAIKDPSDGIALIDTGMPGQADLILEALEKEGLSPVDVKHIVITHADVDHIGSMKALKERTNAKIVCLEGEAGYVSGEWPSYKMPPPERLAENPQLKIFFQSIERAPADITLKDGDTVPGTGGARAVATPGHTPGHMCLYLSGPRIVIAGDALTASNGDLGPPIEGATPDMPSAKQSLKKLGQLEIDTIVAYHGGVVDKDTAKKLEELANSL